MIVGIDAANLRVEGGLTHLIHHYHPDLSGGSFRTTASVAALTARAPVGTQPRSRFVNRYARAGIAAAMADEVLRLATADA